MVTIPLFLSLLPVATLALPVPVRRGPKYSGRMGERGLVDIGEGVHIAARQAIDESLVPEFGVQAGVNPDGTGNCAGIGGKLIPCTCPPERGEFLSQLAANVAAGAAVNNPDVTGVSFPTGDDVASALTRFNAATVTLQNLQGPGIGCPQVATTWAAQVAAIQATGSASSPEAQAAITAGVPQGSTSTDTSTDAAAAAPAPVAEDTSSTDTAASAGGIDASLVPEFGVQAGVNPDGTGNCEGIGGKLIPCSCPPDRTEFLNQLAANVAANAAVNNPDVQGVSFPTGDDVDSALTRFNAATVTLQNLQGPGVGCPQVATTWAAQVAAIQATGSASSAEAQAAITAGVPQGSTSTDTSTDAAAAAPAPVTEDTSSADASAAGGIDTSLVPEFGIQANVNPDGTGNCQGLGGKAIPCSCPPNRDEFISQLVANIQAGQAINNPDVTGLSFPSGDDVASAMTRFNAATVTLQNLQGPGIGCPQVATTWAAQIAAIQASGSASSPEAVAAIQP